MTATHLSIAQTRQTTTERPALKVTGRIAEAVRLMIEEGKTYQEAAAAVGMHVRLMRKAIERPHVLSYIRQQRQVFRATINASNDLRLAAVRDKSGNSMAVVQAVKALEQLDDEVTARRGSGFSTSPGLVINILNTGAASTDVQLARQSNEKVNDIKDELLIEK